MLTSVHFIKISLPKGSRLLFQVIFVHLKLVRLSSTPLQIPHFVWSSPALSELEEKMEYLRQLIFRPEEGQQEGTADGKSSLSEMLTGRVRPKLPRNLGIQEEGLLEDEMVLKVLHTFDKIG